ncbi:MAG: cytochrome P460 family protein [Silvibacterium sp.]|nr:cytochrome P460 family protein [Silvibacterium sp.]
MGVSVFLFVALLFRNVIPPPDQGASANLPAYDASGKLITPKNYREWIYLSSGLDMSYSMAAKAPGHSMFDNVFVNPEAWKVFQQTGKWPDKTIFVLEARMAESAGSINKAGHFQSADVMGADVHVKDESRGGWAFYDLDGERGTLIPKTADCYSCHQQHGAVDTTFVQFYPTLIGIAKAKGTLSGAYLSESGK